MGKKSFQQRNPVRHTSEDSVSISKKSRETQYNTRRSLRVLLYLLLAFGVLTISLRFLLSLPLWVNVTLVACAVGTGTVWWKVRTYMTLAEETSKRENHEEYLSSIESDFAKTQKVKRKKQEIEAAVLPHSSEHTATKKRRKKNLLDEVEARVADGLEDFCSHSSLRKHIDQKVQGIHDRERRKREKEQEQEARRRALAEEERLESLRLAEEHDARKSRKDNSETWGEWKKVEKQGKQWTSKDWSEWTAKEWDKNNNNLWSDDDWASWTK
eukprot:GEMP01023279.1.p1 GENE.GEMP01023279.1~~GEMP01023279.1.p1  ORF type:complete len:270 (+),score=76.83 GEMP01023279.1:485-1294(+)